jgi:hypothetical protein
LRTKLTPEVLEAVRADREERGLTLTQIMKRHDLPRSTAYNAITGLDDSKVQRASPSRRVVAPLDVPSRPPLSKANLGEASRQLIAGRMLLAGLDVFQPLGEDTPIDLLVLRADGRALKCQCKTMFVDKTGVHVMPLCSVRKWGPKAKAIQHRYTRDEVDFFVGYAVELPRVRDPLRRHRAIQDVPQHLASAAAGRQEPTPALRCHAVQERLSPSAWLADYGSGRS